MDAIGDSGYVWVRFEKDGTPVSGTSEALSAAIATVAPKHLVVMSHGWKNSEDDAAALYRKLWLSTIDALDRTDASKVLVVGAQWPARRYEPPVDAAVIKSATPSAKLLSTGGAADSSDIDPGRFRTLVEAFLEPLDDGEADRVRSIIRRYLSDSEDAPAARALFDGAATAVGLKDASDEELSADGDELAKASENAVSSLKTLAQPPTFVPSEGFVGTMGLKSTITSLFDGPRAAVLRLLEQFSYFEMKKRAGVVGTSLGRLLGEVDARKIPLHLVGHSFGGRAVTAAASAFEGDGLRLFSLTLLQGAFSHNAMSIARNGPYRAVPAKVEGPISITHTFNDDACTALYALASRLSQDVVNRIGDRNDRFGSMGANGAQFFGDDKVALESSSSTFKPTLGHVTNFLADAYISDHGDVANKTVGELLAAAIEA